MHRARALRLVIAAAIMALLTPDLAAQEPASATVAAEAREKIALTRTERDTLLYGMRTYLESVQAIVEALAHNRPEDVRASAMKSGKKLIDDLDPSLALVLPMSFTLMSLDTHQKFDALAAKAAAKAPKAELLRDLAAILGNCTGCHASFRVVMAKGP